MVALDYKSNTGKGEIGRALGFAGQSGLLLGEFQASERSCLQTTTTTINNCMTDGTREIIAEIGLSGLHRQRHTHAPAHNGMRAHTRKYCPGVLEEDRGPVDSAGV